MLVWCREEVTVRRRAEEDLRRAYNDLQEVLDERSAALNRPPKCCTRRSSKVRKDWVTS